MPQVQRVALTASKHLVAHRAIQWRAEGRFQQCRRRRLIQRLDLDHGQQLVGRQRRDCVGPLGVGARRDDQSRRSAQRQLVHQGGRQVVQVVRVVDHEQQLAARHRSASRVRRAAAPRAWPSRRRPRYRAGPGTRRTARCVPSQCPPPSAPRSTAYQRRTSRRHCAPAASYRHRRLRPAPRRTAADRPTRPRPFAGRRPPARQPKQSAPPDFMARGVAGMPIGPNALGGKAV